MSSSPLESLAIRWTYYIYDSYCWLFFPRDYQSRAVIVFFVEQITITRNRDAFCVNSVICGHLVSLKSFSRKRKKKLRFALNRQQNVYDIRDRFSLYMQELMNLFIRNSLKIFFRLRDQLADWTHGQSGKAGNRYSFRYSRVISENKSSYAVARHLSDVKPRIWWQWLSELNREGNEISREMRQDFDEHVDLGATEIRYTLNVHFYQSTLTLISV